MSESTGPYLTQNDVDVLAEQARARLGNAREREIGIYQKYRVERIYDPREKHANCSYFVLDPQHDRHARSAMLAYAAACESEYPILADELRQWAGVKT